MQVDDYLDLLQDIDSYSAHFRERINECTLQEFRLMEMVANEPDLRLNDIGYERSVFQQGIGRTFKRLQDRGLVTVIADPRDKRAKNVVITDLGEKVREKCRRVLSVLVA